MPIALSCPCGRAYRVKDDLAGKRIRCSDCGAVFAVPTNEELDAASGIEQATVASLPQRPVAIGYRPNESRRGASQFSSEDDFPPPPRRKKRRRRKYNPGDDRRYRGGCVAISHGVIYGTAMMIGAVIWLIVGLYLGWIFFYPPVLFIVGLVRVVMALLGHEE